MVFSSTIFLFVFLPIALLGYYLIRTEFKNIFLLIISLLFYAWGEPKFIFVLLISIIINYILAIMIDKKRENGSITKILIVLTLTFNLGVLFIFKYLMFTISNINFLTGKEILIPNIVLPIGISFFTFQAISYVLDVYFETAKVQKNILNLGLYIALFPQLVAGPIVRYNSIEKQISDRKETFELFSNGVKRFIVGLSKKIILSNIFAIVADRAFIIEGSQLSVVFAWFGIICYCLQLYYDFSGYSDMAIGLGKMFGFEFEENFDYPYISKSVGEFWRRWHISLSSWLRDYLYTPTFRSLMGKRNILTKKKLTMSQCNIIALFVTWLLCGIWHGANWTFVIFGLYYFIFIAGERILEDKRKKKSKKLKLPKKKETKFDIVRKHTYTLIVVIFGQLIFRSNSIQKFIEYSKSMFGLNSNIFIDNFTMFMIKENIISLIIGILFCMPIAKKISSISKEYVIANRIAKMVVPILYISVFVISISYIVNSSYNPFIYFNF